MRFLPPSLPAGLLLCSTLAAGAQERKPGAYQLTMTTTTTLPTASTSPPRETQVCLTQEMIDRYGAIVPQYLTNICQISNVVKKGGGMTANLICSGSLNGKGTLEVNWSDSEHAKGELHFSGSMHPADKDIRIEWTATTSSAYKGPDCSAIEQPSPLPSSQTPPAPSQP